MNTNKKRQATPRDVYSPARWFVAGMGTMLSIIPVTVLSRNCETITTAQRLGNVTYRVGAYFDAVRNREGFRGEQQKATESQ